VDLTVDVVLVRLSFLVQSTYADVCARQDLSPAQAQLLCVVKGRPRGMTELSRMLRLERPGLSGLVDRVERRGLVRREGASHDRRAVVLTLTAEGEKVVKRFYSEVSDRLEDLVAALPAAERRQLQAIGTKILMNESVPAVFGTPEDH
jgi:DNA-binding MarR family transcriptional regulator